MKIVFFLLLISTGMYLNAQKNIHLASPSGNIFFTFRLTGGKVFYNVSYKNKIIIENSSLSLRFNNGPFEKNLSLKFPHYRDTTEEYTLVVGKTNLVHTRYKEVSLPLEENSAPYRKIIIIVRAFDDGIAFRYILPRQPNWSVATLLEENTTFKLAGDPIVRALLLPDYTTSHEGLYSIQPLSQIASDTLMDMPALFEFPGNVFLAITEAALVDYAGMYLGRHDNHLTSLLSPLPGQTKEKVKIKLPHNNPWRVLLISDRIGALLESNIITTLNEACALTDISWIKPGKTTFPWWNGNVLPDSINAPGNNFVTAKYYIDFCARNNIEYHSVVEYGLHQWYTDDGVGFQPGPHADVTKPVPGLDMKEICDYANKLGVGIRVWVQWKALYSKLDTAFALFEQWGIKGLMVDFMDRDDQEMVNIQTEILQKAARHHMHIQFHGAYKPTGLSRTYPNEFTREGTRNYEVNKWAPQGLSPDHDVNIAFTRLLAGSTDYHLGGFRAVPEKLFKTQYTRPLMIGTRCHMLGMYVVLENYIQMVCDYPAAYEGQDGFEFIRLLPTTWDETKVLDAKAGEYICIARRKDKQWFIGIINNHEARTIDLPLTFLEEGTHIADIYADGEDAETNPNQLRKEIKQVTNKSIITTNVAGGGGSVMRIQPK